MIKSTPEEIAVHDAIFGLWMSKGRKPDPEVVVYWTKRLMQEYCPENIIAALQEMELDGDDWPTVSKVSEAIRDRYDRRPESLRLQRSYDEHRKRIEQGGSSQGRCQLPDA